MKTRRKGNRIRKNAIKKLESEGYLVDVVEKTSRFAKVKDLYGLFDLIAIKDKVKFVQVTCNKPHSHQQYRKFKNIYPFVEVEQLVWIDRVGWKVWEYE